MDVAQKKPSFSTRQPDVHDFDECRNIQKGPVFIIASGASAKDFPLEKYADVPMITMNGAISMFIEPDIKPFFFTPVRTTIFADNSLIFLLKPCVAVSG
ncbi:hypothetical protein D3C86_1662040 [compost metagenome]